MVRKAVIVVLFVTALFILQGVQVINPSDVTPARVVKFSASGNDDPKPTGTTVYPWPMQRFSPIHNALTKSPSPDTSTVAWWNITGFVTYSSPAIADGKVFIGATTGTGDYMFAFYQNNGTLAWRTKTIANTPGGEGFSSSPAYDNGLLFFGGDRLYALYANNGTIKWTIVAGFGNWGAGSPTVANGMVFIGGADRRMYAIYQNNGTIKWTFQTSGTQPPGNSNYGLYSAPAVYAGHIYIAACDGYVYQVKIDQPGPTAIANHTSTRRTTMYGSPAIFDGKVYIGNGYYSPMSTANRFLALDATDLSQVWEFYPGFATSFFGSPAIAYETVYVGAIDGRLYALDPYGSGGTTTVKWQYNFGQPIWSSPAISDGKLFIGTWDTYFYSFNANQSGAPMYNWRYPMNGHVDSAPAISDGLACVGTHGGGGMVYCFGTKITPPDNSPSVSAWEPGGTTGQSYTQGQLIDVRWKITDDNPMPPNNVNISYGSGGSWTSIMSHTVNDGTYIWDTAGVPPGNYYINISAYDSKGQRGWDLGNFTFQILSTNVQPTANIAQPSGGESWSGGAGVTIVWDMSDDTTAQQNLVVYLNYSYSSGGGPVAGPLTGLTCPCSQPWTLPFINGNDVIVLIDVIDQDGAVGSDSSPQFEVDSFPPTITSTTPFNGQTGVATNTNVESLWSEPMNRTATESAFQLLDMSTWLPVSGQVSWSGNNFIFNPDNNLLGDQWYSANFTTQAKDDSTPGNNLISRYSWMFRTTPAADINPPSIMGVTALPSPQEVHFRVNISAIVIDDFSVGTVTADIDGPSGLFNLTMQYDVGSGRYCLDRPYGEIGIHDFTVWASDSSGNWNSSSGQFSIVDTTKPAITSIAVNPPSPEVFSQANVSALVTDNYLLSEVRIDIAGVGNLTMGYDIVSGRYFDRRTYSTIGQVDYSIWAVDTSGNGNVSLGNFMVSDIAPPQIMQVTVVPNPQEVNGFVNISAVVTDSSPLDTVTVKVTWPDTSILNVSMLPAPGDRFYLNRDYGELGNYLFTIWAADTFGSGATASGDFDIVDTTPPVIDHTPPGTGQLGTPINLTATVTDNHQVDIVRLNYTDVGGTTHNVTMAFAGQGGYYLEIPAQPTAGDVDYFFWAVDMSGNEALSTAHALTISGTRPQPPENLAVSPLGRGELRLTWIPPTLNEDGSALTDLRGFNIYRMAQSGGSRLKVNIQLVTESSFVDRNLGDGNTYFYVVRAVNSFGVESDDSNEASGKTPVPQDSSLAWVIPLVIVIVIVVVALILLMKRRKKDEGELIDKEKESSEGKKSSGKDKRQSK